MVEFCIHEQHGGICEKTGSYCNLAACLWEELKELAPIRYGRWIPVYESEISGWNPDYAGYDPIGDYRCSACGKDATLDCNNEFVLSSYCPNCGARMDGGADNGE